MAFAHSKVITGTNNSNCNPDLDGHEHSDTIYGKAGADCIHGRQGGDVLYGQDGYDNVGGGPDDDYMRGHAGRDTMRGNTGPDLIHGDGAGDFIYTGADSNYDRAYGDEGNDLICSADGAADEVHGGIGDDRCGRDYYDSVYGCDLTVSCSSGG